MKAYYNENDPFAAAWLRELIKAGHIAPGDVDERDIRDVRPSDLADYAQHHFFAGIGGWSYALRLAGWPDDRPCWTGSCPCQPFSSAGQRRGTADERHLWPAWFHLVAECRPSVVFGEQVEAAIRHGWLDLVQSDLEGIGYAFGAAGLPAACVGAPHIRQRLWFVACVDNSASARRSGEVAGTKGQARDETRMRVSGEGSGVGVVANATDLRRDERRTATAPAVQGERSERTGQHSEPRQAGELSGGLEGLRRAGIMAQPNGRHSGAERQLRYISSWSGCDWLPCRDGKSRPVESVTEPLVDGISSDLGLVRLESYPDRPYEERLIYSPLIQKGKARIGRLRGYGNAIVAPLAAEFIEAYLGTI